MRARNSFGPSPPGSGIALFHQLRDFPDADLFLRRRQPLAVAAETDAAEGLEWVILAGNGHSTFAGRQVPYGQLLAANPCQPLAVRADAETAQVLRDRLLEG